MNDLTINLDAHAEKPLYEQIYEFIKEEIQNGGLPCMERLPSTRKLADYLEVSRSTVTLAYEQLLSEGYIESRPGSGYYVSSLDGLYRLPKLWQAHAGQERKKEGYAWDFSPSGVDLGSFPGRVWRRISRKLLSEETEDFFLLGDPQGEEELRSTIASYLHQARGVRCTARQIVVGAGTDYLLMLLNAILGGRVTYAMENPTYKKAHDILRILGAEVEAVDTDESGMRVEDLAGSHAQIAYVMPSHQFPLGAVMPAGRRRWLLNWAAEREGRYILEDDYDSEFRYRGRPIPSLQGMDENDRVIYMGTFSKSIAPAIRISFLVLPQELLARYGERGKRFSSTVPRMDQKILAEFIRSGAYERHLNRMRAVYKARHDALLESLRMAPRLFSVSGEYAGTHLLVSVRGIDEERAVEAARESGIRVCGISSYLIAPAPRAHGEPGMDGKPGMDSEPGMDGAPAGERQAVLILGYATMDEGKIKEAVARLTEIYTNMTCTRNM